MTFWQLITTPNLSGSANMQFDIKLFNNCEKEIVPSMLRIYSWRPKCISMGYSQDMSGLVDRLLAKKMGWEVVKRPTGGGIVFHNEAEVTYSLITPIDSLPKGLVPSYKKISEAVVKGLGKIGIRAKIARTQNSEHRAQNTGLCFSYPAEYEIVCQGRKLVGSAQKRGKRALLQQGSIFVKDTSDDILAILKKPLKKDFRKKAVSLEEILGRSVGFCELSQALIKGFEEGMGIRFDK